MVFHWVGLTVVVGQGAADRWHGSVGAGDGEGVGDALGGIGDDLGTWVVSYAGGPGAGAGDDERDEVQSELWIQMDLAQAKTLFTLKETK